MTDRHAGYVVVLANDVREDDAEAILTALRMVKGVIQVVPVIESPEVAIAIARADQAWRARLYELLEKD